MDIIMIIILVIVIYGWIKYSKNKEGMSFYKDRPVVNSIKDIKLPLKSYTLEEYEKDLDKELDCDKVKYTKSEEFSENID